MKYLRTLFLSVGLITLFTACFSQDLPGTKNAVYFELLGNGGYYSINYERVFHQNIYCRIGFATFQSTDLFDRSVTGRITTIPILAGFFTGQNKHHFELGGGLLLGNQTEESETNPICDITSFIGYRYQSLKKGFLFRAGLTPFVSLNDTNYPDTFLLSAGISLGYHF
jgi:hypothetical protein